MPAIRGIYYNHPETGEAGVWVLRTNGQVKGATQAELEAFAGKTGNDATKMERFRLAAQAYLQAGMEDSTPAAQFFANYTPEERAAWEANPPQFYRLDGGQVIAQTSVVTIEVFSVNPLRYQITVSEGASRSETVYG